MRKFISALLMIVLVVPFTSHAGGGQAAGAFADNFMKSYYNAQRNSRENEVMEIERQKLELLKKQQEHQQRMEQQRQGAEQQKNNVGAEKKIADIDGDDWTGFPEAMKFGYIVGFQSGTYGMIIGNYQKNAKNQDSKTRNGQLIQYFIGNINPAQISSGLDTLYGDFKNKQIKLVFAMYIVKKQISGGSAEEVEAILQYLRSNMDSSKLYFIDKDGKKKMASLP